MLVAGIEGGGNIEGYIYTSSDLGHTWTPQPQAGSRNWGPVTVSFNDTKTVLAGAAQ